MESVKSSVANHISSTPYRPENCENDISNNSKSELELHKNNDMDDIMSNSTDESDVEKVTENIKEKETTNNKTENSKETNNCKQESSVEDNDADVHSDIDIPETTNLIRLENAEIENSTNQQETVDAISESENNDHKSMKKHTDLVNEKNNLKDLNEEECVHDTVTSDHTLITTNEEDSAIKNSSSSSEEEDTDLENNMDLTSKHPQKEDRQKSKAELKRVSKSMKKETKSEQQRLKRERIIRIPKHVPTAKPLKDFLKRVPKLEKESDSQIMPALKSKVKPSLLDKIFKVKPRLSLPDSFDIDDQKEKKGGKEMDLFMKRFAKHTDYKRKSVELSKTPKNPAPTREVKSAPGIARIKFKEDLKKNMLKKRQEYHMDLEKQLEFYDEENYEEDCEEIQSDDDSGNDTDDLEEEPEKHEGDTVVQQPVDFGIVPNDQHEQRQWDDSSSISSVLRPGQGEPMHKHLVPAEFTPFSKLLKSGLLDSTPKDSQTSNEITSQAQLLSLPNEDTQDLYKDAEVSRLSEEGEESDEDEETNKFELALDEDTQFDPVLNSQGFLQERKPKKKESAKKLFDDDFNEKIDSTMSMTQILGFCSGQFTAGGVPNLPDSVDHEEIEIAAEKRFPSNVQDDEDDSLPKSNSIPVSEICDEQREKNDESVCDVGSRKDDEESDEETTENVLENDSNDEDDDSSNDEDNIKDIADAQDDDKKNENKENKPSDEVTSWKKDRFYEEEAELSGSDIGSDDEDLGSEYDEYEVDEDVENQHRSTAKLKKEISKIHQRKMLDKDKKEIRLLQELYLEDGDLGDRLKRKRNFRWRNIDEFPGNMSMNDDDDDDGENDDNLTDGDMEKRKHRLERDNYLQEIQSSQPESFALDDCSQSVLEKITSTASPIDSNSVIKDLVTPRVKKVKRSGSFLGSGKVPVGNLLSSATNVSTRSGKSFVFQAADKTKEERQGKRKPNEIVSPQVKGPPHKTIKIDKCNKSVFNLM